MYEGLLPCRIKWLVLQYFIFYMAFAYENRITISRVNDPNKTHWFSHLNASYLDNNHTRNTS